MDPRIAKLLTLPVVVLIQFTLNRRITFAETPRQSPA
jgi:putative flippase GtrA